MSYNYMIIIYIYIYPSNLCSLHNKLKTNPRYLAHEVNRRIDDLIGTLLVIEDLFIDRMRKEVMIGSNEASLYIQISHYNLDV